MGNAGRLLHLPLGSGRVARVTPELLGCAGGPVV